MIGEFRGGALRTTIKRCLHEYAQKTVSMFRFCPQSLNQCISLGVKCLGSKIDFLHLSALCAAGAEHIRIIYGILTITVDLMCVKHTIWFLCDTISTLHNSTFGYDNMGMGASSQSVPLRHLCQQSAP